MIAFVCLSAFSVWTIKNNFFIVFFYKYIFSGYFVLEPSLYMWTIYSQWVIRSSIKDSAFQPVNEYKMSLNFSSFF